MEHEIPFGNSNRENGTTFLDFPLFLGIFQWDEPTKRVPFTAEPEIPEILSKWKAPHEIRPIRVRHLRGYSRPGSWKICGEMYSTANDPETANDPKMDLKWYFTQLIPKVDRKWMREKLRNRIDFMGLIMKKELFSLGFWRKREGGCHISFVYWGIQSRASFT